MSFKTPWGYVITGQSVTLPDLITLAEFGDFTAGKYTGDTRVSAFISAASAQIRNHVGWHLYGELPCWYLAMYDDLRIYTAGGRKLGIQLPARYISEITQVLIGGEYECTKTFEESGLLSIYDDLPLAQRPYSTVSVKYTAGLPDALMQPIKELAVNRVVHALTSSNGVTSEAAGGVSVTYNSVWAANARATALTTEDAEVLAPYKVKGVY